VKQKENESAVAADRWGEDYANTRCNVMWWSLEYVGISFQTCKRGLA